MSQLCRLFVPFWGGELPLGGEAEPLGEWRGTPTRCRGGSTNLGFITEEYNASEGNDWIKLMAQNKIRKENVIRSLLESMRQTVEKKAEPNGTRATKKPRNLPLLEVDIPQAGQRPTLEIRGDCKTIVDWINGRAKEKTRECTVEETQSFLRDWWGRGVHQRKRTTEWATHIFREHNKEADAWSEKGREGTRGRKGGHCPCRVVRGHCSLWVLEMAVVTTAIVEPT